MDKAITNKPMLKNIAAVVFVFAVAFLFFYFMPHRQDEKVPVYEISLDYEAVYPLVKDREKYMKRGWYTGAAKMYSLEKEKKKLSDVFFRTNREVLKYITDTSYNHIDNNKAFFRLNYLTLIDKGDRLNFYIKNRENILPYKPENELFLDTARYFNLLTLQHDFVELIFNDDNLGIMVHEKFPEKERRRKDFKISPVLQFGNVMTQFELKAAGEQNIFYNYITAPVLDANFNVFGPSFDEDDMKRFMSVKEYKNVFDFIKLFIAGGLKPSQVFDVKKMADFLSVAELWGQRDALYLHNMRFYYNAETKKFEPLVISGNPFAVRKRPNISIARQEQLTEIILKDEVVYSEYIKSLKNVCDAVLDGGLVKHLEKSLNKDAEVLKTEVFPEKEKFIKELKSKAERLKKSPEPSKRIPDIFPSFIKAEHFERHVAGYDRVYEDIIQEVNIPYVNADFVTFGKYSYIEFSNSFLPFGMTVVDAKWENKDKKSFKLETLSAMGLPKQKAMPFYIPPASIERVSDTFRLYYRPLSSSVKGGYKLKITTVTDEKKVMPTTATTFFCNSHMPCAYRDSDIPYVTFVDKK